MMLENFKNRLYSPIPHDYCFSYHILHLTSLLILDTDDFATFVF